MGAPLAVWKYSFGSAHRFCSQLNRPRHRANSADSGGGYGRFIWSRPKRQAQHCLPFLFPLYRLPYARYGCAIQRKFCSQLNRPRRSANSADSGGGYGRFIWNRQKERGESCAPFIFVRRLLPVRTDFPQTCRGDSRIARQAEVKRTGVLDGPRFAYKKSKRNRLLFSINYAFSSFCRSRRQSRTVTALSPSRSAAAVSKLLPVDCPFAQRRRKIASARVISPSPVTSP